MSFPRLCLIIASFFAAAMPALAQRYPTTRPYAGVTYHVEVRRDPPLHLFVAEVDVSNPRVRLRVAPGGPDPDGSGEWETTLMRPTKVAEREKFELAVNGDFFTARNVKDAEGAASGYRPDIWAGAVGPAVTNGKVWSIGEMPTPCLVVYRDRRVRLETIERPPRDAWSVVAGNRMLVENGRPVLTDFKARHPRTVVGLNEKCTRLTILVVDGRKPGVSVGMSYAELSEEMIRLGCHTALNLDGGGSSVMVLRDPKSTELRILNDPSDGRERAVANVLGVDVRK